ncbi:hypothetical protein [Pseudoponticoccus marisrubri]|uniref:Transferrin-binding protein B C-lobe/N-lobe beta barrel domain-containing protein n=1 Tax=Pseudoponticoccus marisrubri TaxID=1685382 RepID=A0A0W7WGN5_9RHOB|nr:hypothetical protein [Pseudoponticoccus marisrubri]KUF09646.1 hypothetical protein AVJ23_15925 [Pseudoponticoccus marisrubri]
MALAFAGAVGACATSGGDNNDTPVGSDQFDGVGSGAQPLIDEPEPESETPDADPDPATSPNVYATEANGDLTMNDVDFDPATGELVLNNMPFDGSDNLYMRDAGTSAALNTATGTDFDVYRNVAGPSNYYAVFRRSPNGFAHVAAAGTDRYVSFGFGGAGAERLSGSGALPRANEEYVFNGEYAAVRTIIDPDTGSRVQYVAGTSRIQVDIEDLDDTGAVEGVIVDRRFFDANGVQINALDDVDFISLATSQINFDNWTIDSSSASVIQSNEVKATGTWEGLLAGPNGEEVAGIVVVEGTGPVGIDPATGDLIEVSVRESGTFVGTR